MQINTNLYMIPQLMIVTYSPVQKQTYSHCNSIVSWPATTYVTASVLQMLQRLLLHVATGQAHLRELYIGTHGTTTSGMQEITPESCTPLHVAKIWVHVAKICVHVGVHVTGCIQVYLVTPIHTSNIEQKNYTISDPILPIYNG